MGAHTASYTTSTVSFLALKLLGSDVDYSLHLASRLKKEYRYTSTPLWNFVTYHRVNV
jgi:uncharacterized membrane protein YdfJ with MMPL/SSD domain